ncbi:MAG: HAD-IIIC family phosphatase [Acidobacteriota bacterium]|nr:HAD-IIIC family phosphatase [Acidobacteriota bacterium]
MTSAASQSAALRLCLAGNFTVDPMAEFLRFWLQTLGIQAEVEVAPYNQVVQQLLPGGVLHQNTQGTNLVAIRAEAWRENDTTWQRSLSDLRSALQTAADHGCTGVVLLFPAGRKDATAQATHEATAAALQAVCDGVTGWKLLNLAEAADRYQVATIEDDFTRKLGDIPYTEAMFAAAAAACLRWLRSGWVKPRKVIVLDCDNTLWQGVYAEGTMQITTPFRALQEFMLRQMEAGMLLLLASKNNEDDVMSALASESCVLKPEHFAAWQINWQAKSANLKLLSEDLGLALNSFIFLDDSAYECTEVRLNCPEVLTLQLPKDPEEIPAFLEHLWAFDHREVTDEDLSRTSMYRAEHQRSQLSRSTLSLDEFLETLQLEIDLHQATDDELPRIAQLTQRTTQFNLTNTLLDEAALREQLRQPGTVCWTVRVRDVFGDYGLVGVVLFRQQPATLHVQQFLLSCRALGRRVEDAMLAALQRQAREMGDAAIRIPVVATARNKPAREFLARFGKLPDESAGAFEFVLSAAGEAEVRATEAANSGESPAAASNRGAGAPRMQEDAVLLRIAHELRTAASVVAASRAARPQPGAAAPQPQGEWEEFLAELWAEYLGLAQVGAEDSFLQHGGTSLQMAQMLGRIHATFGVALTLTDAYAAPTVRALAARLAEQRQAV